MERTYVSVNLQNLITVPVMAALGFGLAAVIFRAFKAATAGSGDQAANGGGY